MIGGVRVSRLALIGDPLALARLPGRAGLGMLPARLPSRNMVTAVGAVGTSIVKRRGLFGRIAGGLAGLAPGLLGGPAGLVMGPASLAGRALFGAARGGLRFGAGLGAPGFGLAGGFRRRRRMRVTNVRALRRALSRVRGFERLARRVIRVTPRFHRKIRGRGTRGIRRRRAA